MDPFGYRAPGTVRTVRRPGGPTHLYIGTDFVLHLAHTACGRDLKKDKGALVENRVADEVSCLRCAKKVSA